MVSYSMLELTASGRKDPLFKGIEDSFNVFHLHGETVILTEKMELLADRKKLQESNRQVREKCIRDPVPL